jgi:hypothetical protein
LLLRSVAFGVLVCIGIVAAHVAAASPVDPYEEMLGDVDSEDDYLEMLNLLDAALREPVNLLEADRDEISRLPWVSPLVADGIVALARRGELQSVDDLVKVEGVDQRMVNLLRPFVVVPKLGKAVSPLKGLARMRIVSSPASGSLSEQKTYFRSAVGWQAYEAGLVLEKDRDESRVNDFQSYYLSGGWERWEVVAGNFTLASGHGLVFSNPYGHSPSTVNPWRFSQGDFLVRPYTSVDENFALQGAGLRLNGQGLAVCLAVSRSYFDAGIDDDGRVKSLTQTGYHVSARELEGKDALREDLLALAARCETGAADIKANLAYSNYNRDFSPEFSRGRPEALSKQGNVVAGLDLSLTGRESMLFVEVAGTGEGREALMGGLAFDLDRLGFLLVGRSYDDRFLSLHARPFAFYSGVGTGEQGLLMRLTLKPLKGTVLSFGSDLHRKRRAEGALADPSGSESFADLEWGEGALTVSAGGKLLRSETPPERERDSTEKRSRLRGRLDVSYDVSRSVWLRGRYEMLGAEKDVGAGRERFMSDLVRLDFGVEVARIAEFKAGFDVFTIDDYASRIYQYEPGLPYYPTLELLKSDGTRWYSVISLRGKSLGGLTAKYGRTTYNSDEDRTSFLFYYNLKI